MFTQRLSGVLVASFSLWLCFIIECEALIELLTIGAAALAGLFGAGPNVLKCKISECCEKQYGWRTDDFDGLEADFSKVLHGQHLVKDSIINTLKSHWYNESPKKALVMSFHGGVGTGKNYVSNFIVKRLYKEGAKSKFVQRWIGKMDFPDEREKDHYTKIIQKTIEEKVASCPRSIFIINQVDSIPTRVLTSLEHYLDYHENIKGVDYRKAVFIFISNTGTEIISQLVFDTLQNGGVREEITLGDFRKPIENGAFNERGIANNLVDIYVPFLPLEKTHVKQCIEDILLEKRCLKVSNKEIENIANQVTYSPPDYEYFSRSGCKKLHTIVSVHPCDTN